MIRVWGCRRHRGLILYTTVQYYTYTYTTFHAQRRVGAYPFWGEFSLPRAPLASASIVQVQTPENTFIVHSVISFREFYKRFFENVYNLIILIQ